MFNCDTETDITYNYDLDDINYNSKNAKKIPKKVLLSMKTVMAEKKRDIKKYFNVSMFKDICTQNNFTYKKYIKGFGKYFFGPNGIVTNKVKELRDYYELKNLKIGLNKKIFAGNLDLYNFLAKMDSYTKRLYHSQQKILSFSHNFEVVNSNFEAVAKQITEKNKFYKPDKDFVKINIQKIKSYRVPCSFTNYKENTKKNLSNNMTEINTKSNFTINSEKSFPKKHKNKIKIKQTPLKDKINKSYNTSASLDKKQKKINFSSHKKSITDNCNYFNQTTNNYKDSPSNKCRIFNNKIKLPVLSKKVTLADFNSNRGKTNKMLNEMNSAIDSRIKVMDNSVKFKTDVLFKMQKRKKCNKSIKNKITNLLEKNNINSLKEMKKAIVDKKNKRKKTFKEELIEFQKMKPIKLSGGILNNNKYKNTNLENVLRDYKFLDDFVFSQ